MTDLELAAGTFVERFLDLVSMAKHEAASEFAAERQRFDKKLLELQRSISDAQKDAATARAAAEDADARYEVLRAKLADVLGA